MKIKAMVTKVNKEQGSMVLFTQDRQFKNMPLPDHIPALGSVIEFNMLPKKRKSSYEKKSWFAAAVILLVALFIGMFSLNITPVSAYVNLDMKSGVQLSVDNKGLIKEVATTNEDGEKLMAELDIKDKDIYLAVKEIINKAGEFGYFDSNNENLVMASITSIRDTKHKIDEEKVRNIIRDELSSHHYPGYVVVTNSRQKQWQKAQDTGHTVNELMISERAKMKGIDIKPENLQNKDVMHTIKESNTSVQMLFPKESCRVTWEESEHRANEIENPKASQYERSHNRDNYENRYDGSNMPQHDGRWQDQPGINYNEKQESGNYDEQDGKMYYESQMKDDYKVEGGTGSSWPNRGMINYPMYLERHEDKSGI